MKCPNCGSETHRFDNVMYACDKCDWIRHADEVINTLSERAEKAEGELKAIKARIEAVEELATIENGHFVAECRWNAGYNTGIFDCKEIIKQIGGEK